MNHEKNNHQVVCEKHGLMSAVEMYYYGETQARFCFLCYVELLKSQLTHYEEFFDAPNVSCDHVIKPTSAWFSHIEGEKIVAFGICENCGCSLKQKSDEKPTVV